MKNLIATILLCVFVAVVSARFINDDDEVARLNSLNAGWEAGHNDRFSGMTHEEASGLLGLTEVPREVSEHAARDISEAQGLPSTYDSRTVWPQCVMPIKDQGSCGACWAFASSSVLGMRMCIQSNGAAKVDMSPQVSINCNTINNACSGGTLGGAWEYFVSTGSVAESSLPFTGKKGSCSVSSSVRRYKASTYSRPSTVAAMQTAIYSQGAIQVGLDIYSDFYNYKSGVYRRTSNSLAGGHSVYLVGWGTLNGVNYWLAINSWGSNFGNKGAFMIERGVNMCNIEKGYLPVAGTVAASSIPTGTTTTTRAPTTTTRAPTTTTRAPTTTTRAPTTTTRAPTTTTRAPTTTTKAPTTTTRAPTTTTTTRAPTTTTKAPTTTTTTRAPTTTTTTRAPTTTTTTKAPTTTTRAPTTTTTTRAPTTTTKAPTTTTKAPTTTTKAPVPTHNCWTCAAGWTHWYDQGLTAPTNGDKCQCLKAPATTTKAPTTTTKAPVTTTTTKAPATTTKAPATTTKSPSTATKSVTETLAPTTTTTTVEPSEEQTVDTNAPASDAPTKQETEPYSTISTDAPSSEAPTNGGLTEQPQKLTTNSSGSLVASLTLVIACIMFAL